MKAKGQLIPLVLAGAMLPVAIIADPLPSRPSIPPGPLIQAVSPKEKQGRVSDLLGENVVGREGQIAGKLTDVVIDLRDGRVVFGVVTTQEDERKIAVPAGLLKAEAADHALAMGCSEQRFRASSDFSKADLLDPSWANTCYVYYGVSQPGQQMMAKGPVIVEAAGAELSQFAAPIKETNAPITERAAPARMMSYVRWSDLAGNAVSDKEGKPVGDIRDAVVDGVNGHLIYAVLDASGVKELAHKYIAVAPTALKPSEAGGSFTLNVNKSDLDAAPSVENARWPAASDKAFQDKVNQFYSERR